MVGAWPARWLLTAVFAAACLGSVPARGRAATARVAGRISDVFHVLMCAALIAMTWRSEPIASVWFQTALFGCAVIWFGLASPGGIARSWAGRLPGLHHALMAGTMIWMITAMAAAMRMVPAGPARSAMSAMPAMPRPATPGAVLVVSVLLVAYFALAAVPWLMLAVGPGPRVNDRAAAGHAAMSAGMAAMLLAML